jgi:Transposase DDE domain
MAARQPRKDGKPQRPSDGLRAAMKAKLASDDGKARYAKRRETVEPVFGQLKEHLFSVKNISPPLICASRAREYRSPPVFSMAVFQAHSTWCCHLRSHTGQQRADEHG